MYRMAGKQLLHNMDVDTKMPMPTPKITLANENEYRISLCVYTENKSADTVLQWRVIL